MNLAACAATAVWVVLLLSVAGTGCSTTAGRAINLPAGVGWDGKGPVSEYDEALVRAIQARWFSLLEGKQSLGVGMVKVSFWLHADGTIESPSIMASTAQPRDVDLAARAISEAAPFGAWPPKLVRRTSGASREIGITFYYQ